MSKRKIRLIILVIILIFSFFMFIKVAFGADINIKKLIKTTFSDINMEIVIMTNNQGMGRQEILEKYKTSPKFCLVNSDCVRQKTCGCCDTAVNRYNNKLEKCDIDIGICEMECDYGKLRCKDNNCTVW